MKIPFQLLLGSRNKRRNCQKGVKIRVEETKLLVVVLVEGVGNSESKGTLGKPELANSLLKNFGTNCLSKQLFYVLLSKFTLKYHKDGWIYLISIISITIFRLRRETLKKI